MDDLGTGDRPGTFSARTVSERKRSPPTISEKLPLRLARRFCQYAKQSSTRSGRMPRSTSPVSYAASSPAGASRPSRRPTLICASDIARTPSGKHAGGLAELEAGLVELVKDRAARFGHGASSRPSTELRADCRQALATRPGIASSAEHALAKRRPPRAPRRR